MVRPIDIEERRHDHQLVWGGRVILIRRQQGCTGGLNGQAVVSDRCNEALLYLEWVAEDRLPRAVCAAQLPKVVGAQEDLGIGNGGLPSGIDGVFPCGN